MSRYKTRRSFFALLILALLVCTASLFTGCLTPHNAPVLLSYTRSGGIAGFQDHLVLYENGTLDVIRNTGNSSCILGHDEMTALDELLTGAGFDSLAGNYPAPVPGADYFSYEITYRGKTIRTETTGIPEALSPVIPVIDRLLTRCDSRP